MKNLKQLLNLTVMIFGNLSTWPKFQKMVTCDVIVWRSVINIVPFVLSLNLLSYVSQIYSN